MFKQKRLFLALTAFLYIFFKKAEFNWSSKLQGKNVVDIYKKSILIAMNEHFDSHTFSFINKKLNHVLLFLLGIFWG